MSPVEGEMVVLQTLTAVAGVILGMGMSTTSVYIVLARLLFTAALLLIDTGLWTDFAWLVIVAGVYWLGGKKPE